MFDRRRTTFRVALWLGAMTVAALSAAAQEAGAPPPPPSGPEPENVYRATPEAPVQDPSQAALSQAVEAVVATSSAPPTVAPLEKPRRKAKRAPAPAPPPTPATPVEGTTHQDPLLLACMVALGVYQRRKSAVEDQDMDYERWRSGPRVYEEPPMIAPVIRLALPAGAVAMNYSWTAMVPGTSPVISSQTRTPEAAVAPAGAATESHALRVLLAARDEQWLEFQSEALQNAQTRVTVLPAAGQIADLLRRCEFDIVIVDAALEGENSPAAVRRWMAEQMPGMEARLIVTVSNLEDPETAAFLEESKVLTLTRPCSAQDLRLMVRLASQRPRFVV